VYLFIAGHDRRARQVMEGLGLDFIGSLHHRQIVWLSRSWQSNHPDPEKWPSTPFTQGG
jgi:hypothetical protein